MVPSGYPLKREDAEKLLEELPSRKIAVVGDFHLDVYWHADMRKASLSRETPHFARPVVEEKYDPGVGGVIAANLRALGVGTVYAVGACGDDWRGDVLKRRLREMGVDITAFRTVPGRVTPTYIKPMIHGYESVQEDPRLDFQDPRNLPPEEEKKLLEDIRSAVERCHGVVVIDQIEEPTGGIVTEGVRNLLSELGSRRPDFPILADSRARIGLFRNVTVKVNRLELGRALGVDPPESVEEVLSRGEELSARMGRLVLVSAGAQGLGFAGEGLRGHVPAIPVRGPLDPVGAGDSASAGLISAFACGAEVEKAAAFANLTAAVTVQKLGETGTASPEEILALFGG